jgi:SMC interacting uncharacterized protein involved in chromosome segregation
MNKQRLRELAGIYLTESPETNTADPAAQKLLKTLLSTYTKLEDLSELVQDASMKQDLKAVGLEKEYDSFKKAVVAAFEEIRDVTNAVQSMVEGDAE